MEQQSLKLAISKLVKAVGPRHQDKTCDRETTAGKTPAAHDLFEFLDPYNVTQKFNIKVRT